MSETITVEQVKRALFLAWDVLNGDKDPSNRIIEEVSDVADALGYDIGWEYAEIDDAGDSADT